MSLIVGFYENAILIVINKKISNLGNKGKFRR